MNPCVRSLAASAALFAATLLPAHAELDVISLKKAIETSIASDYPKLDALYKELHAHPELAFQEVKTAARLAAEMRALGFEVTENVGKTGLVAIYKNGDGPTIMVRTELDGLPMEEKTGLDYASRDKTNWNGREVFVAHSCGHDIHMASWVGTAKTLLGLKDQWRGTLMFIAQPAEEIVAGARAMLARWPVHALSQSPTSRLPCMTARSPMARSSIVVGVGSSAADGLEITFHGRGGHGSAPQTTIDPVDDCGALHRRRAKRDQPRKGSNRIRRRQHRRHSRRHRRKHHSRLRAALRDHPLLQARGSRQNACRDRANGEGRRRDVGCARARRQDPRGHQARHQ